MDVKLNTNPESIGLKKTKNDQNCMSGMKVALEANFATNFSFLSLLYLQTMTNTPPVKLWVLLKTSDPTVVNLPVKVSTESCDDVCDFIDAIKKKLPKQLDDYDPSFITLHLTQDSPALEPDDPLPAQNTKQTALVVTVLPINKSPLHSRDQGIDILCERVGCDPTEGLPTTIASNRVENIQNIISKLNDHICIVHSSPPMSGKSAICTLLMKAYRTLNPTHIIVRLNCSAISVSDFAIFKEEFYSITSYKWEKVISTRNCLLILDDSHLVYHIDVCVFN